MNLFQVGLDGFEMSLQAVKQNLFTTKTLIYTNDKLEM